MANIQKELEEFDAKIKLNRFDENKVLREKRDIVLDKLRDKFAKMRNDGKAVPRFEHFNQGSYEMGTGIQPVQGDYDIDVGLRFNCSTEAYKNPVDLKHLVADALEEHTELGTVIRRSCVTVNYKKDGEQTFHVDLAVYAYDDPDSSVKKLHLAKGKEGAGEKDRWWERSDPIGLASWVESRFSEENERRQFLRVVRLLKRWKSKRFETAGTNSPHGIGLTIIAGRLFAPKVTKDEVAKTETFDDLEAMRGLVTQMLSNFYAVGKREDGSTLYRLKALLPVEPGKDVFEKMTDGQMTTLRERLEQFQKRMDVATNEADPVEACREMSKEFGNEFPVPEKEETADRRGRAVTTPGQSA